MADDYTGFKTAFSSFVTKALTDRAVIENNEQVAMAMRTLIALLRAEMTAQGITI